jgi:hypothetical protein
MQAAKVEFWHILLTWLELEKTEYDNRYEWPILVLLEYVEL